MFHVKQNGENLVQCPAFPIKMFHVKQSEEDLA